MRFLVPTAAASAVLVLAGVLFLSTSVSPVAAGTPRTADPAATATGSGTIAPETSASTGRIGARDSVAPKFFWKKFWKAFKAVIGGLINFIDGLIDNLGGGGDELPRGGYGGLVAAPEVLLI